MDGRSPNCCRQQAGKKHQKEERRRAKVERERTSAVLGRPPRDAALPARPHVEGGFTCTCTFAEKHKKKPHKVTNMWPIPNNLSSLLSCWNVERLGRYCGCHGHGEGSRPVNRRWTQRHQRRPQRAPVEGDPTRHFTFPNRSMIRPSSWVVSVLPPPAPVTCVFLGRHRSRGLGADTAQHREVSYAWHGAAHTLRERCK